MTFHAYLQYVCLLVVCLCTLPSPMEARVQADRQSTGTRDTLLVIDQESGLPIEGAYILTRERLLVSSPRGMIVFGHGTCFMDTVLVQCLGYGSRRVPLNEVFKESSIHTVCLSPDIQKLGEVVVTGERAGASPNVVSRRLSSPEIRNALGTSLATLLERVSGVSSISTGTTVSKPVIQGMYGNRILIIHNGARQTGQQWGADHAPEVDMNGSSSVSVIKGSDAVRYGSDALEGLSSWSSLRFLSENAPFKGESPHFTEVTGVATWLPDSSKVLFPVISLGVCREPGQIPGTVPLRTIF